MTPAALDALDNAGDWVGYGLYLDLVAGLRHGRTEHRFALGEEEARVRHAIDLAANGRSVALVCSGDAGIYAMASLVFEALGLGVSFPASSPHRGGGGARHFRLPGRRSQIRRADRP